MASTEPFNENAFLDLSIDQGGGFKRELELREQGFCFIAGVDEAGRGPLAGPVVAAAFIVKIDNAAFRELKGIVFGVNDSKKLSPKERADLYLRLTSSADLFAYGVGIESAEVIDQVNILEATKLAMKTALDALPVKPDYLLVDGLKLDYKLLPGEKVIKGDAKCYCIAAASIIAKVVRDNIMEAFDRQYPQYGFGRHKGYGTKLHREMLEKLGPIPKFHRLTFAPVSSFA